MLAEAHGAKIPGRQQSQGEGLIALDGFPLGLVIDETQVFQALAPFGEGGGVQDEAVVPDGLGPLKPPPQIAEEAPIKRPLAPFCLLEAVEGVFLGLKSGLKRAAQQVVNRPDVQEYQVGEDVPEIHGWNAFALANAGYSQMALNMQHGKQLLDPQFQVSTKIIQGRFDLSFKASEVSVMQGKAPFVWYLLTI